MLMLEDHHPTRYLIEPLFVALDDADADADADADVDADHHYFPLQHPSQAYGWYYT